MVTAFETKRFATVPWIWGVLVAFALVLGFAAPSYAFADDSPSQQAATVAAADDVVALLDETPVSEPVTGATSDDAVDDEAVAPLSQDTPDSTSIAPSTQDTPNNASTAPLSRDVSDTMHEGAATVKGLPGSETAVTPNAYGTSTGKASQNVEPTASDGPQGQEVIANVDDVFSHGKATNASSDAVDQLDDTPEKPATQDAREADASKQGGESQATVRAEKVRATESPASMAAAPSAQPASPAPAPAWTESASAYEAAAVTAQEAVVEQPVEQQPVETIAPPAAVRYPGSPSTAPGVPCAYIGAAQSRVDAPAPSSLYAVLPVQKAFGGVGSVSFTANSRSLHAALLYHKARCRSP